jgi:hypothetical protein
MQWKTVRRVRRAEMGTTLRRVRKTKKHRCGAYINVNVTKGKNRMVCLICGKVIGEVLPKSA